MNDGSPVVAEIVSVKKDSSFSRELDIHENDAFLINLIKL